MNTADRDRLSASTYSSQVLIETANLLFFCCLNSAVKTRLIISLQCGGDMKAFSNTALSNCHALCMRGSVCVHALCVCVCVRVATTMLLIDLEANHRVSKHPSQNITLKPFRGVYRHRSCALSVLFVPL